MGMMIEALLAKFYQHARQCLGLPIPDLSGERLRTLLHDFDVGGVQGRLSHDCELDEVRLSRRSIVEQTGGLVSADIRYAVRALSLSAPVEVIDFGSGAVTFQDAILGALPLAVASYRAIDPELADRVSTALGQSGQRDYRLLVICRNVLHHITAEEQNGVLEEYRDRQASLIVIEDELGATSESTGNLCSICADLDARWNAGPSEDRLSALRINDIWSNVVVYGRGTADQLHRFVTMSDQVSIMIEWSNYG
jgi:hypothetical protein